jgi:hypothetical protein
MSNPNNKKWIDAQESIREAQVAGIDYFDTYSAVAAVETIRLMLALTAEEKLYVRQVDIKTAYLYAKLDEPLYVQIPEGYKGPKSENLNNKCLKLLKALPGTKQGAKQWFKTCTGYLTKNGYKQLVADG